MSVPYKDYLIKPAIYDRPKGVPFEPRAILIRDVGSHTVTKTVEWPDRKCDTQEEAEQLAVQLAKAAIDLGEAIY